MSCSNPLKVFRSEEVNPDTGKQVIVFDRSKAYVRGLGDFLSVPCGHCLQCRLARSRVWAVRCLLESELYSSNCFITLTYNNSSLPPYGRDCARCESLALKEA